MTELHRFLETLARRHKGWVVEDDTVTIPVDETHGARHQVIRLDTEGPDYVFTSTVVHSRRVTKDLRTWRILALRSWRRNAEKNLVTFAFSARDDLIGLVRHPQAQLDLRELEASLVALARECDRFEFVLTGDDVS